MIQLILAGPRPAWARRRSIAAAIAGALALLVLGTPVVRAHGADPTLSGANWRQDQVVPFAWTAGQVPPAWLQAPVIGAATDAAATSGSRAAHFTYQAGAASTIAYGQPTGCSSAGIACFSRNAPTSFRIWFRAHGYRFDWGTLVWCQGPSGAVDGCFDAENIGLDELGHVLGLGHHANYGDDRDYADAVVQTVSRARPRTGWNAHAFGRCDVARLQLIYDRPTSADPFSTCLSIATTTGLQASSGSAWSGTVVAFSATLRTVVSSSAGALSGDPVSGRTVLLERRPPGGAGWTTVATMSAGAAPGTYTAWVTITGTYEWRARFPRPASEGLLGSTSGGVPVTLLACSICPNELAAPAGRAR